MNQVKENTSNTNGAKSSAEDDNDNDNDSGGDSVLSVSSPSSANSFILSSSLKKHVNKKKKKASDTLATTTTTQAAPFHTSPLDDENDTIEEPSAHNKSHTDDTDSRRSELSEDMRQFGLRDNQVIRARVESDFILSLLVFLFVFALHVSTLFTVLRPYKLDECVYTVAILLGFLNNYILPHLRLENPWYILAQPILKPAHWSLFEPNYLAKLECYEAVYVGANFAEKNVVYMLALLSTLTSSVDAVMARLLSFSASDEIATLDYVCACAVTTVIALKLTRDSFCEPYKQYKLFFIAFLYNRTASSSILLFDLYVISMVMAKFGDLLEKLKFIFIYTAPWQLPWGSAFHAFAQPLSMPHTALLLLQTIISSLLGAPLMPLMGSAIFLMSYMRPIKFWEYTHTRLGNAACLPHRLLMSHVDSMH